MRGLHNGVVSAGVGALVILAAGGGVAAGTPEGTAHAAQPLLSPERAVVLAVNDLQRTPEGFVLRHPLHQATFTSGGIVFAPRRDVLRWRWELQEIKTPTRHLAGVPTSGVEPVQVGATTVEYRRGTVVERYLLGERSLEQQFVLRSRPDAGEADLIVTGRISTGGRFVRGDGEWHWRGARTEVVLRDVSVFDARGTTIAARMRVTARGTRIVVDGKGLARARYPVTIDPEIGASDFQISQMGAVPSAYDAFRPTVAYNPAQDVYLVVWEGDEGAPPLADDEFEIYGELREAFTGTGYGDVRISDLGPDGNAAFDAVNPAVAYDAANNEFLVVWEGDDSTDDESEIYGQRLSGTNLLELGANDFLVSDLGPSGNAAFDAVQPAATYNATNNEYLVVWSGDDVTDGELEIYGQRLNAATGAQVGTNDFAISDMGPAANAAFDAAAPAVAYNGTLNEYLVTWDGDDATDGEFEIYGQRLNAATGTESGINDFAISDMGPAANVAFDAVTPAVAYSASAGEYLVVWEGDDNLGGLVDDEREIFGQRLTALTGLPAGTNDFRISDVGPNGNAAFDAGAPAIAWNATSSEYLVVWEGDDVVDEELEIRAQRLTVAGAEVGSNDFAVSDVGPSGNTAFAARAPALAAAPSGYLTAWHGDDPIDGDEEIRAQRLSTAGAETGEDDFPVSDMVRNDNASFAAGGTAGVAYNPSDNEYLVVWPGTDDVPGLAAGEYELYGQRLNAATGAEVGATDFRISDVGPDGSTAYGVSVPAVAYNSVNHQYLVVWAGDDDRPDVADNESEIWGQRLTATGDQVGASDFRISDMGPEANPFWFAAEPDVAYSATENEYLVVWYGVDDRPGLAPAGETEIWGQRLSGATGAEIGTDDFRISDSGPDGQWSWGVTAPDVAYNAANDEYLVVWSGDADATEKVDIFGQRLAGVTAAEVGTNDFQISFTGGPVDYSFTGVAPASAYNPVLNQYLVVWEASISGGSEIYGQRLSWDGLRVGASGFQISSMYGPSGQTAYRGGDPDVAYHAFGDEYLVVWNGHDYSPSDRSGIFGQRLSSAGSEIGTDDFFISELAPGQWPKLAYNSLNDEDFVAWFGVRTHVPPPEEGYEIFGQRLAGNVPTAANVVRFGARRVRGGFALTWRTASEVELVGFHLWRLEGSSAKRLDSQLIAAKAAGRPSGSVYRYLDAGVAGPRTYRLEAVGIDGRRWPVGTARVPRRG